MQEKIDRRLYEENMNRNINPINQRYNPLREETMYEEHLGDIQLIDYRLQADVNYLQRTTCLKMKAEFLRNSFHVINFKFDSDPLSGALTGIVSFKVRIQTHKIRDLEKFISNRMGLTIKYKK
jgi:hypothetical protein